MLRLVFQGYVRRAASSELERVSSTLTCGNRIGGIQEVVRTIVGVESAFEATTRGSKSLTCTSTSTRSRPFSSATGGEGTKGTKGVRGGKGGDDKNVEWRQWIEKRLAELEEKGVLKKSHLETKGASGGAASQRRSGVTMSPLNQAILRELKKLPAPDPATGFAEIGNVEEDEDEEAILEIIEAAVAEQEGSKKGDSNENEDKDDEDDLDEQERADMELLANLKEDSREKVQAGRINPNRMFFPGQTYELEDLDPYTEPPEMAFPMRRQRAEEEVTDSDDLLLRNIHFMNYDFLSRHVTEQGKILPRRKTGLKKKTQRKLVRTIKTARQMAILPINSRVRDES